MAPLWYSEPNWTKIGEDIKDNIEHIVCEFGWNILKSKKKFHTKVGFWTDIEAYPIAAIFKSQPILTKFAKDI